MNDGGGVAEMYSRLAFIMNEIAGLGSEEMTDKFIIKKILRALDGKYDTVCTLIQMMPNYKDLKPMEVIGRIVAHEMSLKDKEECRCQNRRILGRGSRTVRLRRMITGGRGHNVLPRFGPS